MSSIFKRKEDVIFKPNIPFDQQAELRQTAQDNRTHWLEVLAEKGLALGLMQGGQYGEMIGIIGDALGLEPNATSNEIIDLIKNQLDKVNKADS